VSDPIKDAAIKLVDAYPFSPCRLDQIEATEAIIEAAVTERLAAARRAYDALRECCDNLMGSAMEARGEVNTLLEHFLVYEYELDGGETGRVGLIRELHDDTMYADRDAAIKAAREQLGLCGEQTAAAGSTGR
jgi:hypothetical protein